jgi:hypothetical protein
MVGVGNRTNLSARDMQPLSNVRVFIADPSHAPRQPLNIYTFWSPPTGFFTNYTAWGHTPGNAWNAMNPGHYDQVSNSYGPEFTTARDLANALNETVYVAKYALGGSLLTGAFIPTWHPDMADPTQNPAEYRLSLYHAMVKWAKDALAAARLGEPEVQVAGFFWMQGESDASQLAWAQAYQTNLANFIRRIRTDFDNVSLPFVFARISDSRLMLYREPVRVAQAAVDAADTNAVMVNTDDLPLSTDNIHYTDAGLLTLGQRFARAWLNLNRPPVLSNSIGASLVLSQTATLNGSLTATGGAPTQVAIYWGPTDGGTNPSQWRHCVWLGIPQGKSFSVVVTNLAAGKTYSYRCFAENAFGQAWATSTATFTTLAPAVDQDGDGLADAWELLYFSSIKARDGDASEDADNDGVLNLAEYIAGTVPTNAASRLTLRIEQTNGAVRVNFVALSASGAGYEGKSRWYDLESRTNFSDSAWQGVAGWTNLLGDDGARSAALPALHVTGFYRMRIRLE